MINYLNKHYSWYKLNLEFLFLFNIILVKITNICVILKNLLKSNLNY